MRTFFTSDPHFYDDKTAQRRGFPDAREQDRLIIQKWDETVTEGDEVWILGDLARSHDDKALTLIAGLPGVKHLVSGNHDGTHPMHRGAHKRLRAYLDVFETVQQSATLKIGGERVTLSHFPFTADHTDPPRHMEWRVQDTGKNWLMHGHTHSEKITDAGPRQIHVGMDAWNFTPVPTHVIETIITHQKNYGPPF